MILMDESRALEMAEIPADPEHCTRFRTADIEKLRIQAGNMRSSGYFYDENWQTKPLKAFCDLIALMHGHIDFKDLSQSALRAQENDACDWEIDPGEFRERHERRVKRLAMLLSSHKLSASVISSLYWGLLYFSPGPGSGLLYIYSYAETGGEGPWFDEDPYLFLACPESGTVRSVAHNLCNHEFGDDKRAEMPRALDSFALFVMNPDWKKLCIVEENDSIRPMFEGLDEFEIRGAEDNRISRYLKVGTWNRGRLKIEPSVTENPMFEYGLNLTLFGLFGACYLAHFSFAHACEFIRREEVHPYEYITDDPDFAIKESHEDYLPWSGELVSNAVRLLGPRAWIPNRASESWEMFCSENEKLIVAVAELLSRSDEEYDRFRAGPAVLPFKPGKGQGRSKRRPGATRLDLGYDNRMDFLLFINGVRELRLLNDDAYIPQELKKGLLSIEGYIFSGEHPASPGHSHWLACTDVTVNVSRQLLRKELSKCPAEMLVLLLFELAIFCIDKEGRLRLQTRTVVPRPSLDHPYWAFESSIAHVWMPYPVQVDEIMKRLRADCPDTSYVDRLGRESNSVHSLSQANRALPFETVETVNEESFERAKNISQLLPPEVIDKIRLLLSDKLPRDGEIEENVKIQLGLEHHSVHYD